ncbi:hypothetical protein MCERE19_01958 [Spirosomataceae bacterium]|jgi:hypothetical protein
MKNLEKLVRDFNSTTLPKAQWTHEAHLIVAIWYCKTYDLPKALYFLRYHIKTYNISVSTPNSETQGYHETLTRFWLLIAANFIKLNETKTFEETAEAFVNSDWAGQNLAFDYYSKETLFSVEARKDWVGPNLEKLPIANEMVFCQ